MNQPQRFNPDASANELGVYRWLTGWYQCWSPAGFPDPEGFVRAMNRLDPGFRLLWVTNVWLSPNEGTVKTTSYALGRYVRDPHASVTLAARMLLPTHSRYGVRYRNPIVVADIRDGLTNAERSKGQLPRFEPMTGYLFRSMEKAIWLVRNEHPLETHERENREQDEARAKRRKGLVSDLDYRRAHDRVRLLKAQGKADRVFVSDTLRTLRAAAGMEATL